MAPPNIDSLPYAKPEGEACNRSRSRPIDLAHLARQTMGDRTIEQEVLAMFVQQALLARKQIARAGAPERIRLAHTLKGAARGIGAFAVADCAEAIERDPHDKRLPAVLAARIDEARQFIAAISR